MLPIETIISPTDFSRPSEQGLAAAVDLSRQFDAGLVLLHVIAPLPAVTAGVSVPGHHMPTILDELDRESRRLMDRLVQDRVPSDLPCRTQIVRGRPADEIVRLAEEMEAAMIVIASHGASGIDRFLFGSVAERVVHTAANPVLTIKAATD